MHEHISKVCQAANFELRKIASVRAFLTPPATIQLVTSLVLSRLDYCNSLYGGLPDNETVRLQVVQNNAARLIFRRSKRESVTSLLIQLHWLPVKYRIKYKIATLAYQKFAHTLPEDLSVLLKVEKKPVNTRLSKQKRLDPIADPRTKIYGNRMFGVLAPEIWNSLPSHVREADSMTGFKSRLKTVLFRSAYKDEL
jgi:hypothetical protein